MTGRKMDKCLKQLRQKICVIIAASKFQEITSLKNFQRILVQTYKYLKPLKKFWNVIKILIPCVSLTQISNLPEFAGARIARNISMKISSHLTLLFLQFIKKDILIKYFSKLCYHVRVVTHRLCMHKLNFFFIAIHIFIDYFTFFNIYVFNTVFLLWFIYIFSTSDF